ncbi:MAG: hypothetical protein IJ815_08335, partial [Lachnospiraceae bacterium]|nr:hypothetical protein [Lachnospiraceae bacterium]
QVKTVIYIKKYKNNNHRKKLLQSATKEARASKEARNGMLECISKSQIPLMSFERANELHLQNRKRDFIKGFKVSR